MLTRVLGARVVERARHDPPGPRKAHARADGVFQHHFHRRGSRLWWLFRPRYLRERPRLELREVGASEEGGGGDGGVGAVEAPQCVRRDLPRATTPLAVGGGSVPPAAAMAAAPLTADASTYAPISSSALRAKTPGAAAAAAAAVTTAIALLSTVDLRSWGGAAGGGDAAVAAAPRELDGDLGDVSGVVDAQMVVAIQGQGQRPQHPVHALPLFAAACCHLHEWQLDVAPAPQDRRHRAVQALARALPRQAGRQVPVAAPNAECGAVVLARAVGAQPGVEGRHHLWQRGRINDVGLRNGGEARAKGGEARPLRGTHEGAKFVHCGLGLRVHEHAGPLDDLVRPPSVPVFACRFEVHHEPIAWTVEAGWGGLAAATVVCHERRHVYEPECYRHYKARVTGTLSAAIIL